jgi:hypothetical protein
LSWILKYRAFKSFHILSDIYFWFDLDAVYPEHGVWCAVNWNRNVRFIIFPDLSTKLLISKIYLINYCVPYENE